MLIIYNFEFITNIYKFDKDGYTITFNTQNNTKAQAYYFKNGSEYQYKKNSNTINFKYEEEKVRLGENIAPETYIMIINTENYQYYYDMTRKLNRLNC